MTNRTSLYQNHLDAGAKMVDFSGWEMPINYGSQIEEHTQVRAGFRCLAYDSSRCVGRRRRGVFTASAR